MTDVLYIINIFIPYTLLNLCQRLFTSPLAPLLEMSQWAATLLKMSQWAATFCLDCPLTGPEGGVSALPGDGGHIPGGGGAGEAHTHTPSHTLQHTNGRTHNAFGALPAAIHLIWDPLTGCGCPLWRLGRQLQSCSFQPRGNSHILFKCTLPIISAAVLARHTVPQYY